MYIYKKAVMLPFSNSTYTPSAAAATVNRYCCDLHDEESSQQKNKEKGRLKVGVVKIGSAKCKICKELVGLDRIVF